MSSLKIKLSVVNSYKVFFTLEKQFTKSVQLVLVEINFFKFFKEITAMFLMFKVRNETFSFHVYLIPVGLRGHWEREERLTSFYMFLSFILKHNVGWNTSGWALLLLLLLFTCLLHRKVQHAQHLSLNPEAENRPISFYSGVLPVFYLYKSEH